MHKHVPLLQRIINELKCLLKMRSHLVTRQIDSIDDLMINLLGHRVTDTQHCSRSQHYHNNHIYQI